MNYRHERIAFALALLLLAACGRSAQFQSDDAGASNQSSDSGTGDAGSSDGGVAQQISCELNIPGEGPQLTFCGPLLSDHSPLSADGGLIFTISGGVLQMPFSKNLEFELALGGDSLQAMTYDAASSPKHASAVFSDTGPITVTPFFVSFHLEVNVQGLADVGNYSLMITDPGAPVSDGDGGTTVAGMHGSLDLVLIGESLSPDAGGVGDSLPMSMTF